jgi:hypothetical protein
MVEVMGVDSVNRVWRSKCFCSVRTVWFDAHSGLPKAAVPARTPKALRAQVLGVVDERGSLPGLRHRRRDESTALQRLLRLSAQRFWDCGENHRFGGAVSSSYREDGSRGEGVAVVLPGE